MGLPLLDAMVPAGRNWRDPADGFVRLVTQYEAMGCAGGNDWGDTQHLFAPAKLGRDFEIANGAGFLVALTGTMMRMPALPTVPAAERIQVSEDGVISGI